MLENEWQVLRLRYTYKARYDRQKARDLTSEEYEGLNPEERKKLTHRPLDSDQIEMLVKIAVELHSRAIAQKQERRWWKPVLITAGLSLVGSFIGALAAVLAAGI
jgi:hypothetical protein